MELSLNNKLLVSLLTLMLVIVPHPARSQDVPSASHITDESIIEKIGTGVNNMSVWCYNDEANAILISSAERAREQCRLKISQELERQSAAYNLQIDTLSLELSEVKKRNIDILKVKDQQINDLTTAALKRPNSNIAWWATGGFILGATTVLGIIFLVK